MNTLKHIGLVGPIATDDMAHLLDSARNPSRLPDGYAGAPLLATLIGELLGRGFQVSAFTISNDVAPGNVVHAYGSNLTLTYCSMRPRAWRGNGGFPGRIVDLYKLEREALRGAIEAAAPDVIHAHWAYEFALAALACSMPAVVTCHDSPYRIARLCSTSKPTVSLYRWLRVLMARRVLQNAPIVTAVSPYMRDEIQPITAAPIDVVSNPVDDLVQQLVTEPRSGPAGARLIMICNGWDSRKNAKPALQAFAEFKKMYPAATLHLYGSGFGAEDPGTLWCRRQGIDAGMQFHGRVAHRTLLRTLLQIDLLVHPSIEESFGLVLAEAMAMGVPVVAGENSGAVPWVVGEHGALCNVSDPAAILAAITDTLRPDRYAQLSAGGMQAARERFSTTRVVNQFCGLYQRGLDAARPTGLPDKAEVSYGNH